MCGDACVGSSNNRTEKNVRAYLAQTKITSRLVGLISGGMWQRYFIDARHQLCRGREKKAPVLVCCRSLDPGYDCVGANGMM